MTSTTTETVTATATETTGTSPVTLSCFESSSLSNYSSAITLSSSESSTTSASTSDYEQHDFCFVELGVAHYLFEYEPNRLFFLEHGVVKHFFQHEQCGFIVINTSSTASSTLTTEPSTSVSSTTFCGTESIDSYIITSSSSNSDTSKTTTFSTSIITSPIRRPCGSRSRQKRDTNPDFPLQVGYGSLTLTIPAITATTLEAVTNIPEPVTSGEVTITRDSGDTVIETVTVAVTVQTQETLSISCGITLAPPATVTETTATSFFHQGVSTRVYRLI
ncbi:hypothetical protein AB5N19_14078 [Seiridium cardinale]